MATSLQSFYHKHQTMIKSFFLLLISLLLINGIHAFGYTNPHDTLYLFENDTVEIECGFDLSKAEGYNSSHLVFNETCDNAQWTSYDILSNFTKILSSDKMKLTLRNRPYSRCNYTCQLPLGNVAVLTVIIGRKLSKVKQFKCLSKNQKIMECKFVEMDNNIPIKYNVSFTLDNGAKYRRNLSNDFKRTRSFIVYNETDKEHDYFKHDWNFYFELHSNLSSAHGVQKFIELFEVEHYAVIVPAPPESFIVENIETNAARLSWSIPRHLFYILDFDYEVKLKSEYDEKWEIIKWNSSGFSRKNTINVVKFNLTDLKYAYAQYTVQMRYISRTANHADNEMWSEIVKATFTTKPKNPDRPPNSWFGSFHINANDKLIVYWEGLDKSESNGANLRYIVSPLNGQPPYKINNNSAEFERLLEANKAYEIQVYSKNDIGSSDNALIINIPKQSEILNASIHVVKSYNDKYYNLTWTVSGPEDHLIDYYNIYWCSAVSELPDTCDGKISYTNSSGTSFLLESSPSLNFAVSGQSRQTRRTTGMHWNHCSSNPPNGIGKPSIVYFSSLQPRSLLVKWEVDCRDSMIIKSFNITYCQQLIQLESENVTYENCSTQIVRDPQVREYNISELRPYTMYRVLVSMNSVSGKKGKEFEKNEKTRETAPSPVRNLTFKDVTNTSILLSWVPPEFSNGEIHHYTIHFCQNITVPHCEEREAPNLNTSYILNNLKSYTTYDILVFANTVERSSKSNCVRVQTSVGVPAKMESIPIDEIIAWKPPEHIGGNLTFYELRIMSVIDGTPKTEIFRINAIYQKCIFMRNLCQEEKNEYRISIRAVNIVPRTGWNANFWIENNILDSNAIRPCESDDNLDRILMDADLQVLPGEWSDGHERKCYKVPIASIVLWTIVLFVFIGMAGVGIYLLYKTLYQCSDLKLELPEAMKSITLLEPELGKHDSLYDFFRDKYTVKELDIQKVKQNNNSLGTKNNSEEHSRYENAECKSAYEEIDYKPEAPLLHKHEFSITPSPSPMSGYIPMENLTNRLSITSNNTYVPVTKGITTNNYIGDVVHQQQNRNSFKEILGLNKQTQNSNETAFQPQRPVNLMSGYVPPGQLQLKPTLL